MSRGNKDLKRTSVEGTKSWQSKIQIIEAEIANPREETPTYGLIERVG